MKDKKEFGAFIAEKRKERGLTQAELAAELFVTVTAVSKWERGVTYPDITMISDLCRVLSVTEHELIEEGNDAEYRRMKLEAVRYRRISDIWFYTLTCGYALALLVCFICNLAVNRKLSWFFIVFTALLTAFSLFPSVSRFIKRGKVATVSLSFLISLSLLLMTCCIYVRGSWFAIALTAVLFGFCVVMLPVYSGIYPFPKIIKRYAPLICVTVDFILLVALVICCTFGNILYVKRGIALCLYAAVFVYSALAFICYLNVNKLIRAALACETLGIGACFSDAFTKLLLGDKQKELFKINLLDWSLENINGNIMTIVFICVTLVSTILLAVGIYKSLKNRAGN